MPRTDPFRNLNFFVEILGLRQAGFAECSGLGASTEPLEVAEGGVNSFVHRLPAKTKQTNIVLKWGLTDSREFYDWYRGVVAGRILRMDGSIVVLDMEGREAARWNFVRAWPTKWDGPNFSAKANDVAIETLELAHHGLERAG